MYWGVQMFPCFAMSTRVLRQNHCLHFCGYSMCSFKTFSACAHLCLQLLLPQGSYKSCFSQATGIYCETYGLMIVHFIRQSSRMIMSALMLWTSYLYELLMTQSYCTPLFCHVCSTVAWCPKTNLICCAVETCSRDQGSVLILEVDL